MHRTFRRWLTGASIASACLISVAVVPAQALTASAPAGVADGTSGFTDACPPATDGNATCMAMVSSAPSSPAPGPLGPADLRTAYRFSSAAGSGQTVAVVEAGHYATAAADLSAYRSNFGIAACTTANGCFKQVTWTGGTDFTGMSSATDNGDDVADAASMDMISAVCPNCHILLVEANVDSVVDINPALSDGLGAAENEAVALGAKFIVNPWGDLEDQVGANEQDWDTHYFNHPGVVITAASGDHGYSGGIAYPAASPDVIAVGGTDLQPDASPRGYSETAWSSTGSGCSAVEPIPAWQTPTSACLTTRMLNDVAAAATSGNFGISYYDAHSSGLTYGSGTAFSAAIVAAAYALAGPPAPGSYPASYLYTHPGALWDISTGSTGTCSTGVLCNAGAGWDGPTGMGTPLGINAFQTTGARPVIVTATGGITWAFGTAADGSILADSLPSGSSTWSGLTSLGGDWPGYPAALATSDGSVWVFAIDGTVAGGSLWADQLPSGSSTWSGWTEIGDPGTTLLGTPTALQDNTGQIDVFARASGTGHLYETTLPSGSTTWSGFTNLGGVLPSDVAGKVGTGGWIYLLGVGTSSALYYDELPPGGTWTGWTSIGGQVTGVPATIQDASGARHVFVRRISDGTIMTSVLTGSPPWPALSVLGGSTLNDPVSWAGHAGTNWVFTIDDSALWYDKESGTTWSGFQDIQSGYIGVPGIVQDNGGTDHLVAVMTDGKLAAFSLAGSAWAPPATVLGGSFLQS